ncbi:MAG: DegV family protein [Clostridium sp.]
MQKIALLTDSSCDLDPQVLAKYNIKMFPFRIIYSDKEYEDGVTITPQEVYDSLEREIPTTSLPSIENIESVLTSLEDEGYTHVISINISSELSGTFNSVRLILNDHPKLTSFCYDTKTLCLAQGLMVLNAAKMLEEGKSFEDIVEALPKMREKINVYFTLSTLEYLKKGGRIGKVAGTIGELLSLKPIIHVGDDGIYHTHCKVRGRRQSLSKLEDILKGYLDKGKCNIAIVHGDGLADGTAVYESIKSHHNVVDSKFGTIGPALGVHTGPGLIAFIVEELDS